MHGSLIRENAGQLKLAPLAALLCLSASTPIYAAPTGDGDLMGAPSGEYNALIVGFTRTGARADIGRVTVPFDFETDPTGLFSASLVDLGTIPGVSLGDAEVRFSAPSESVRRLDFRWSSASPDESIIPTDTLFGGEELIAMAFEFNGFDEPLFGAFGRHGGELLNADGEVAWQSDSFGFFLTAGPDGLGGYNNLTIPDGEGGALDIAPARYASYSGFFEYTLIPEPATLSIALCALALLSQRR